MFETMLDKLKSLEIVDTEVPNLIIIVTHAMHMGFYLEVYKKEKDEKLKI